MELSVEIDDGGAEVVVGSLTQGCESAQESFAVEGFGDVGGAGELPPLGGEDMIYLSAPFWPAVSSGPDPPPSGSSTILCHERHHVAFSERPYPALIPHAEDQMLVLRQGMGMGTTRKQRYL